MNIQKIISQNQNQINKLIATGDKRRKLDAKLMQQVSDLLEKVAQENNIQDIENVYSASSKSLTTNLGQQVEGLIQAYLSVKGLKDLNKKYEFATLINNTPNNSMYKNYLVVVIKSTTKGVYLIDKETMKTNDLVNKRLTLTNVLKYGKLINSL